MRETRVKLTFVTTCSSGTRSILSYGLLEIRRLISSSLFLSVKVLSIQSSVFGNYDIFRTKIYYVWQNFSDTEFKGVVS